MPKGKILLLEPQPAMADPLLAWCRAEGYQARLAPDPQQAFEAVEGERWDLVLIDECFAGGEFWEIRGPLAEADPDLPVIVTTNRPSVDSAVRAFKNGACDYLAKPFELAVVAPLIEQAMERGRALRRLRRLREQVAQLTLAGHLVDQSPAMRRVKELIERVAPTDAAGMNRPVPAVSKPVMDLLLAYRWPGNVRELENAIERALVSRQEGPLSSENSPFQREVKSEEGGLSLEEVERRHIERIVRQTNGNLSQAARILKIDRTTLYNKLRRYGLR